jgi:heptosyltransferase-2
VVVAPSWLGDAAMALPALGDLGAYFAGAHLTVAARASVAPFYTMVSGVHEVLTLPGRGGWAALRDLGADAAALRGGTFDVAVLLPNSFRSALTVARAGIPERWGFDADWRGRYLTRRVPRSRTHHHHADYYRALLTGLGIATGTPYARVNAPAGEGRALLRAHGVSDKAGFIACAPGAAYGRAKQWLPERYAELAALAVTRLGHTVVLVGSRADRGVCAEIGTAAARQLGIPSSPQALKPSTPSCVVDLSGHTSLVQLASVLAASSAVVTNDSGAMHLAAAVGARVIAVFGATDEVRTAPLRSGPDAPAAAILTHDVFCRPCLLRECPIDHRCMRGVTAERVFEAVARAVEPQGVGRKP